MPQARWTKYLLFAVIVLVLAIIFLYVRTDDVEGEAAPQSAAAERVVNLSNNDLLILKPQEILDVYQISGVLQPEETLSIIAPISGTIKDVQVKDGQEVKEGQVLVTYDEKLLNASLQGQKAALEAAKVQVANADKLYKNAVALNKQGYLSKIDLSTKHQGLLAAQAQLKRISVDFDNALKSVSEATIKAPFDGVVSQVKVNNNQIIPAGTAVALLENLSKLKLVASAMGSVADQIHVGSEVRLSSIDSKDRYFEGKVSRVSPVAYSSSLSVPVYIEVDNKAHALRGGAFVVGNVVLKRSKDILAVPSEYVFTRRVKDGPLEKVVYAAVDGKLVSLPVTIGRIWDEQNLVELKDGVKAGTQILKVPLQAEDIGVKYQLVNPEAPKSDSK